ncbi:MAG: von Willebrand factor type [Candidatus Saccharibacteria bacterium]|nr:von Willebrand factor type [Candidatus Saccharibacteria bacterium]
MGVASKLVSEQFEAIDLQTRVAREPVVYPTGFPEIERMSDLSQIADVIPDQLGLDNEQFEAALVGDELLVMRFYDFVISLKRIVLLIDVSGSMDEFMGDLKRTVWALGVALQLLLRAKRGEAHFTIRFFDGTTHQKRVVETPEQADELIALLLQTVSSGGGTDIQLAIMTGCEDIHEEEVQAEHSDILVITDGESPIDEEQVRSALGDDIRLHVALIAKQSEVLKGLATSYREYN